MKVYLFLPLLFLSCVNQKECTATLENKDEYFRLNVDTYKFYDGLYDAWDYHYVVQTIANLKQSEFKNFEDYILAELIMNKRTPDYLFTQTRIENGKKFKDKHINYYKYIPITADTLAGRLIESYQKYDSIYIGKHTLYKYEVENGKVVMKMDKQINYDTIYPVCWSKALKIAKKIKIKNEKLNLIAPEGYPKIKLGDSEAIWKVYNSKNDTIKINAYSGKLLL